MRCINSCLLIVCTLGLTLFQCKPRANESMPGIPSYELDGASRLGFEDCVSEVAFIPLLAPKDTLINLSCKVYELVVNEKIYYASRCINDLSIHTFDLEGNHLKSWNRKGDGPGEYPSLHGLMVDEGDLYVNTGRGTLLKYRLPEFEFQEEFKLGDYNFVPSVSPISSGNFLISSEPAGNAGNKVFHTINTETKTSNTLPVSTLPYSGELNPGMITKMEAGHLLSFGLTDTIYRYQNDSLSIFISLNFGEKAIDPVDFELSGEAFMKKILLSQNYAFNTGHIDFTEGVLKLLVYGIEKNPNFNPEELTTFPFFDVFLHRNTGKSKMTKSLLGIRNKSYSKDGFFYQVMQRSDWQRALDLGYFGKYEAKLLKSIENLTDREDPIIIKYKVAF